MHDAFIACVRRNPANAAILDRVADLDLPDCWLVSGCLFQTWWNVESGREPDAGIRDYDIFYFDDRDLSWEAEDREITRVGNLLGPRIELRNQARVHLWYEAHFGFPGPQLRSACDGIDRFPVAGTCIGLGPDGRGGLRLYAPFGLDDMRAGILRPNPNNPRAEFFAAKAESYRRRWPWLKVVHEPASLVHRTPLA